MVGFMLIDKSYINSYEVVRVSPNFQGGSEIFTTDGFKAYAKDKTPAQVLEMIAEAREENEGR